MTDSPDARGISQPSTVESRWKIPGKFPTRPRRGGEGRPEAGVRPCVPADGHIRNWIQLGKQVHSNRPVRAHEMDLKADHALERFGGPSMPVAYRIYLPTTLWTRVSKHQQPQARRAVNPAAVLREREDREAAATLRSAYSPAHTMLT